MNDLIVRMVEQCPGESNSFFAFTTNFVYDTRKDTKTELFTTLLETLGSDLQKCCTCRVGTEGNGSHAVSI